MKPTVAIVGATGAVGRQMLTCIKERNLDVDIKLLASPRSKGKIIEGYTVQALSSDSFQNVDFVLGATDNDVTKQWIQEAKRSGCITIDNSSAFRLDKDIPLVIPEINPEDINKHSGIIANPNCATIIALVALNAIHQDYEIESMIVTTFQAVSGAGIQGIKDLENQIQDPSIPSKAFPYPIAYNLIPQIGEFDTYGITKEEAKLENESRKIWHHPDLLVNCTCVRVPIMRSHSESITIRTKKRIDIDHVRSLLSTANGVKLEDDTQNNIYPMPLFTSNQDLVSVGRLRLDHTDPSGHSLSLFCCGDQIRKGAATNAIQILEHLL